MTNAFYTRKTIMDMKFIMELLKELLNKVSETLSR